jgi:hypothetical protein
MTSVMVVCWEASIGSVEVFGWEASIIPYCSSATVVGMVALIFQ